MSVHHISRREQIVRQIANPSLCRVKRRVKLAATYGELFREHLWNCGVGGFVSYGATSDSIVLGPHADLDRIETLISDWTAGRDSSPN